MNFQQVDSFTLELTENEQGLLLQDLDNLDDKYWSESLEDLFTNVNFLSEFIVQYVKIELIKLLESIEAIPYEKRGQTLNRIYCAILNETPFIKLKQ